jgi:hypothetical protein
VNKLFLCNSYPSLISREPGAIRNADILVYEGWRQKRHPHTIESWNNYIDLYEAWGKPEKANEWRAELPQAEAVEQ